jgi:hypothetical protein
MGQLSVVSYQLSAYQFEGIFGSWGAGNAA